MHHSHARKFPQNRIQVGPKKKVAFVCSGGATKAGAFHLGVALALQEQGFKFIGGIPQEGAPRAPGPMEVSTYVGSSAGSIISTYLAAGYSLDNIFHSFLNQRILENVKFLPKPLPRLTYQKMFRLRREMATEQIKQFLKVRKMVTGMIEGNWEALLQFRWLKTTGLFTTAGIEQYLREEVLLSNRFEDLVADLFVVATQLNHSRKVVFGKYNFQPPPYEVGCQYDNTATISEACASSTALPFIYSPFAITNKSGRETHYIDGEIRDTLSTHVAVDAGADLVIASYTHQPYHFIKEMGSLTEHGLPAILIQSIYLLIEQKIRRHVHSKELRGNAIRAVDNYCRTHGIAEEHRKKIRELMEHELHHKSGIDVIYIHPRPQDHQMFFKEHFSLSPKKMTDVVKSGFKAGIDVLRHYDFADREHAYPVSETSAGRETSA